MTKLVIDAHFTKNLIVLLMVLLITLTSLPTSITENIANAQEFRREETVFVTGAQWTPPSTWNPMSPSQTWGTYSFGGFLYLPLFQYVPGIDMWIPVIGESFEMIDPYTLRVRIRSEARWSDGKPITAYDVEYTYNLSMLLGTGPAAGSQMYVKGVKAVSDKEVEFYINNQTRNYIMFLFYSLQLAPIPKHIYEYVYSQIGDNIISWRNCGDACSDVINLPQVVSGPYRLYYFDELRVVYVRIDNWWGKAIFGLPSPRYLIHRIYLSNEQVIADLMQGSVDWSGIFIPYVWQLTSYGVGTYYSRPPYFRPNQILVLYINNRVEYLRDPALRKAIAYAIDYDEIIEKAWYGYTRQASMSFIFEIYPQFSVWIDKELAQKYWGTPDAKVRTNKTYAKMLLDQAGYIDLNGDGYRELPNGQSFNITIMVPSGWTDWMIAADLIAGDLREIGINAQASPIDYGAYWGYLSSGTYTALLGWTSAPTFSHPWDTYRYLLDPRITPPAGNWGWYNNTEIIELIDESSKAFSFEERMKYFSLIQEIIYREIPAIPLVYTVQWYEYSTLYWTGWPSESNPWWTEVAPYKEYSLPLWVLFGLAPRGQTPPALTWARSIREGGILIPNLYLLQMLANITGAEFEIPTETSPSTITENTSTEMITEISPGQGVQRAPAASTLFLFMMIAIAVVTIGIIVGVRILVKKRG
ncbi:MAG: ABC transporter substrate-binding protein [Desulfurococcaceae archaeon]